jgi:hypothetical protein
LKIRQTPAKPDDHASIGMAPDDTLDQAHDKNHLSTYPLGQNQLLAFMQKTYHNALLIKNTQN